MRRIDQELAAGAVILDLLERRRTECGDAAMGSAIERAILDRCLADLDEPANQDVCRLRLRRPRLCQSSGSSAGA